MKKKINKMLVLTAALAIFCTMLLITVVYYDLFRRQVLEDLRTSAALVTEMGTMTQADDIGRKLENYGIRMTVIDSGGEVVFDNEADPCRMENHSARPEIAKALETGEGQTVRRSETFSKSTFYYAVRTKEGGILRLSKDAGSIYSIFWKELPSLCAVLLLLVLLCMIPAHFLTGRLIQPIENLAENLDGGLDRTDYEELTPFVSMIRQQHENIMKNAMMRQEFTANVSHELKTPLTSISGYAELIETGMASEEDVTRFAHGIHSNANRLLTLINDTIRLSELDGTQEETVFERLDLYELAATCVEMLAMSAQKHGVVISVTGEKCYINGGRQMIEELLYNLCDNAIRYNNEGGRVDVKVFSEQGKSVLAVSDTGIGISKEHQERIFERFYRVDKSRSKQTGGTGLGLAIVKHIIAKHNAGLELDSEEGKGTTVKVIFEES